LIEEMGRRTGEGDGDVDGEVQVVERKESGEGGLLLLANKRSRMRGLIEELGLLLCGGAGGSKSSEGGGTADAENIPNELLHGLKGFSVVFRGVVCVIKASEGLGGFSEGLGSLSEGLGGLSEGLGGLSEGLGHCQ
jgi:hypothetical protein